MDASAAFANRQYDVAMVGAQLDATGGVYERRQEIVESIRSAIPSERVAFRSGLNRREMAAVYSQARIVVNEGGTRHYPITMRVFEAIGSGSLLLTDDLPGTSQLFTPGEHYRVLSDDVVNQVTGLLDDVVGSSTTAKAAHAHALGRHTYGHRVDELFAIAAETAHVSRPRKSVARGAMASLIDKDVDVQRLAAFGLPELVDELPTREVWDGERILERLKPDSMEAVAVGESAGRHLRQALRAARKFAYVAGNHDAIDDFIAREAPSAQVIRSGDLSRIDFLAPAYRVFPVTSQQADEQTSE